MKKTKKIPVGVHNYRPLVFKENGKWKGLEVDVWETVAERLGLEYEYVEEENFPDLLARTKATHKDKFRA